MKAKISLIGALTGAMGIGFNIPKLDGLMISFFVILTALNTAILLLRNQSHGGTKP